MTGLSNGFGEITNLPLQLLLTRPHLGNFPGHSLKVGANLLPELLNGQSHCLWVKKVNL